MAQPHPLDDLICPRLASRYRQAGVLPGWSRDRFLKLCGLLNRPAEVVGAMAGLRPAETRKFMRYGRFTAPASLHFAMIEGAKRMVCYGEPFEMLMPLDWLITDEDRHTPKPD